VDVALTVFISTYTTLLAIINPLEAMPVFLALVEGRDEAEHVRLARRSCLYATLLMFFFLAFGTIILKIFGVPLSMVRIVGGIILMRLGFALFAGSSSGASVVPLAAGRESEEVAFVPLAMPIMFGPGALATILGMTSLVRRSEFEALLLGAISLAIVATMGTTYLFLAYARRLTRRIGPKGIDAATRLVGFFVSAMGMALIFHGVIEALTSYGLIPAR